MSAHDRSAMQFVRESAEYAHYEPEAYRALYRLSFRSQFHQPDLVDRLEFYIAPDLAVRSERFGGVMQDISEYDIHDALVDVNVPALLLYGSEEAAVELSGPELEKHLPDARLVVVPDAGHFPFVEQPDVFMREVLGFLDDRS